jgi:hypothetical protein
VSTAAAVLLAAACLTVEAAAQGDAELKVGIGRIGAATVRTIADMEAFDAANPEPPTATAPSTSMPATGRDAAAGRGARSTAAGTGVATAPDSPALAAATVGAFNCESFGQLAPLVGGGFPPSPHGAVGANHFGHVVNSAIRFYSKTLSGGCPTVVVPINQTLAAFLGYATKPLYGARLIYDLTYGRWIVSAAAQAESGTVQRHFVAVSKDSDPTHGFFVNEINVATIVGTGHTWDFPQVGYDEEAIILTGNKIDSGSAYTGSTVVFLPKHRLYAGLAFDFSSFNSASLNVGTIAPPIVLDQGPYTVLAAANVAGSQIRLTKWVGTSHVPATLLAFTDVATLLNAPPPAEQPGSGACPTANCLDTGDGRFANHSTQAGSSPVKVWQARTDSDSGFPTPMTYRIDADTGTIEESCEHFASVSSYDFNPSIVANAAGTYFVTWNSTDPTNSANVQIRVTSKATSQTCITPGVQDGVLVVQSANPLTGNFDATKGLQRWGEYSAVSLDPADGGLTVWGVNEKVRTGTPPTAWKTQIFKLTHP